MTRFAVAAVASLALSVASVSSDQQPAPAPTDPTVSVVTGRRATGLYHRAGCPWLQGGELLTMTAAEATTRYFQPHCLCTTGHDAVPPCTPPASTEATSRAAQASILAQLATLEAGRSAEEAFTIVEIDAKVTETNTVWWKFAWKLTLRSGSSKRIGLRATIEFQDKDGFAVDDDATELLVLEPYETRTFTGYDLVRTKVARTIEQTNAKVRLATR